MSKLVFKLVVYYDATSNLIIARLILEKCDTAKEKRRLLANVRETLPMENMKLCKIRGYKSDNIRRLCQGTAETFALRAEIDVLKIVPVWIIASHQSEISANGHWVLGLDYSSWRTF